MPRHDVSLDRVDFDEGPATLRRAPQRDRRPTIGIGHALPDADRATTVWHTSALRTEPFDLQSHWAFRQRLAHSGASMVLMNR
jgi:hypothetical protein